MHNLQIQEALTYIAITIAFGFVLQGLYKVIFPVATNTGEHGCSSNCHCDAVKLRKELMGKKRTV